MSAHKKIPKKIRLLVYEKCNHRCAYCGCELEYKDMQVDHVKSVFANTDVSHTMTEEEMYSEKNFLPACRQCNFYKSCGNLESFREALTSTLMRNLQKTFQYRLAIKYGLIQEHIEPVQFYFEKIGINIDASDCGQKEDSVASGSTMVNGQLGIFMNLWVNPIFLNHLLQVKILLMRQTHLPSASASDLRTMMKH